MRGFLARLIARGAGGKGLAVAPCSCVGQQAQTPILVRFVSAPYGSERIRGYYFTTVSFFAAKQVSNACAGFSHGTQQYCVSCR